MPCHALQGDMMMRCKYYGQCHAPTHHAVGLFSFLFFFSALPSAFLLLLSLLPFPYPFPPPMAQTVPTA